MMPWSQNLRKTETVSLPSLRERLWICYLTLFELPEEGLSDIRDEILYKIQWYNDLAAYEVQRKPALEPPEVTVTVNKSVTRPPFYLPLDDE